jgi:hypothetical protein
MEAYSGAMSPAHRLITQSPQNTIEATTSVCCPYQKVHLVAHQHIPPRDLNTARAVGSLCRSADLDVGPHVFLLMSKRGPGERVATVATFTEGQTACAGALSLPAGRAVQSVRRSCGRGAA